MLNIEHLSKKYRKNKKNSVDDLSLFVKSGEIFGFLGRNGAGKSTTIKCVMGIVPFERGTITVCGYDLLKSPKMAKQQIGYVSDERTAYENLTGREYVNFMGNVYSVPALYITSRLNEYAERFRITDMLDLPIATYSFGLKQKISIIAALVHEPKLWILDEPIIGLDPESANEIKQCMLEHKNKGNTVFFSSHYVEMVEKLCDRVAVIKEGRLLEIIDMAKFRNKHQSLEEYYLRLINQTQPKDEE